MRQRDDLEFASIECEVRELSYVLMHTALTGEHIDEARVIAFGCAESRKESFEEGKAAVGESDSSQFGFGHEGFVG